MWKIWLGGMIANLGLIAMMKGNRGEVGAKAFTQADIDAKVLEATKGLLSQDKVDGIVQERLARAKSGYVDYDELKEFKSKHLKDAEVATQKDLEAKKEYEKLKEGWVGKEKELQDLLKGKDTAINDMKIGNALMGEVVKQNAYAEETIALIKGQAVIDKEGNIRIKGKDANGQEVQYSVEEGIKNFLAGRQHLIKAKNPGGGGTPPGNPGGGGGGDGDLNALNAEMLDARNRGDAKKIAELKPKMAAMVAAKRSTL